ncbi:hypothetical protein C9374_007115 [Naegleria lovaniensis]|uniref:Uncharacterized protein n=1 Tax=Naegleria lovaniensis TaxID=51637 RepID=A0AA88GZQ8_NAELO|nr:uncharacterized protein C9374_007115 [Naegleria lovaniensis]KAG2393584.1 hypothetical protein C9374_007115 [Naegleria lovaniensis]
MQPSAQPSPLTPKAISSTSSITPTNTPIDLHDPESDAAFNSTPIESQSTRQRSLSKTSSVGMTSPRSQYTSSHMDDHHNHPHIQQYLQLMKVQHKYYGSSLSSESMTNHKENIESSTDVNATTHDILYFVIHSIEKGTCWFSQSYEKVELLPNAQRLSSSSTNNYHVDTTSQQIPSAHNKQIISQIMNGVHEDWKSQNSFTIPKILEDSNTTVNSSVTNAITSSGCFLRTVNNESCMIIWKIPPKSSFCFSLVCTLRCNLLHAEHALNQIIAHTAFKKDGVTPIDPREFLLKPEEILSKLHHQMPHGKLTFLNFTKGSQSNMYSFLPDFVLN